MENKDIYIHIGYPKTATTTLQTNFFSKCSENFYYIGYPESFRDERMLQVIRYFTHYDNLYFSENKEQIRYEIYDYINKIEANKMLLSEEAFSVGRVYPGFNCRKNMLDKIKYVFPGAKIIAVLRNQKDLIRSFYLQKVKHEKIKLDFSKWIENEIDNSNYTNFLSLFRFYDLLKLYHEEFGSDNVKVLFFEDLLDNNNLPKNLVNFMGLGSDRLEKLQNALNTRENTQLTYGQHILNRLPKPALLNNRLLKVIGKKAVNKLSNKIRVDFSKEDLKFLDNYYKNNNYKLQNLLNIQLNYRYFL